jgi:hypothetical protein
MKMTTGKIRKCEDCIQPNKGVMFCGKCIVSDRDWHIPNESHEDKKNEEKVCNICGSDGSRSQCGTCTGHDKWRPILQKNDDASKKQSPCRSCEYVGECSIDNCVHIDYWRPCSSCRLLTTTHCLTCVGRNKWLDKNVHDWAKLFSSWKINPQNLQVTTLDHSRMVAILDAFSQLYDVSNDHDAVSKLFRQYFQIHNDVEVVNKEIK